MAVISKYCSGRTIIRRKLINDKKISYINKEMENMRLLIEANWDIFGWINTEDISKLFDIPLQRGVSNTKMHGNISDTIKEIHERNSFCSCLR